MRARGRGRRVVVGALFVLAATLAATTSVAADRANPPAVGEAAPDLQLRDQNGRSFVLRDVLKERDFVVLAFYPKAFTGG